MANAILGRLTKYYNPFIHDDNTYETYTQYTQPKHNQANLGEQCIHTIHIKHMHTKQHLRGKKVYVYPQLTKAGKMYLHFSQSNFSTTQIAKMRKPKHKLPKGAKLMQLDRIGSHRVKFVKLSPIAHIQQHEFQKPRKYQTNVVRYQVITSLDYYKIYVDV